MKANEIKEGGEYIAKVSGNLTVVKVTAIREVKKFSRTSYSGTSIYRDAVIYECTNLKSGRSIAFRSAAKFRRPADEFTRKVYLGS